MRVGKREGRSNVLGTRFRNRDPALVKRIGAEGSQLGAFGCDHGGAEGRSNGLDMRLRSRIPAPRSGLLERGHSGAGQLIRERLQLDAERLLLQSQDLLERLDRFFVALLIAEIGG